MSILAAIIAFDILVIIYEIMVEVFSALYEVSGLTREQARFQVTSLLTGTGFTTQESEKMLETRKRKRLTRNIMIVSYIFNVSIISTLITLFTSAQNMSVRDLLIGMAISLVIIGILFATKKNTKLRIYTQRVLWKYVGRVFYDKGNSLIVHNYYDDKMLAEVKLNKMPKGIRDKKLEELELREKYGIEILYIKRKNKIITPIKNSSKIYRKDVVAVLGTKENIEKIFIKG